jgi:predicted nucleic acid-binding protein
MKSVYLDTNVLVRFVTGEPEKQAQEVAKLVCSAESGKIRLCVLPIVLAEAVYVLNGFYQHPRAKVSAALAHLLGCPGFHSPEHDRMIESLELFATTKIDFADCYLAAASKMDHTAVVSFDRDFDKIPGVTRKPPGEPCL